MRRAQWRWMTFAVLVAVMPACGGSDEREPQVAVSPTTSQTAEVTTTSLPSTTTTVPAGPLLGIREVEGFTFTIQRIGPITTQVNLPSLGDAPPGKAYLKTRIRVVNTTPDRSRSIPDIEFTFTMPHPTPPPPSPHKPHVARAGDDPTRIEGGFSQVYVDSDREPDDLHWDYGLKANGSLEFDVIGGPAVDEGSDLSQVTFFADCILCALGPPGDELSTGYWQNEAYL